jgi:hypothetical protein
MAAPAVGAALSAALLKSRFELVTRDQHGRILSQSVTQLEAINISRTC